MNTRRDPDRLIRDFLMEGQTELADPVYDAVRDRIERTRQRAVIGPWREPDMNRFVTAGLAAAAVLVVVVVGYQLLPGSTGGGATPTATPTATPEPTATPQPTTAGGNAEGPFIVWEGETGVSAPITVTIAAPGWYGAPGVGILVKNNDADPPDGAGMIVFGGDLYVYGDPCQWSSTTPETPATTVDELVAALGSQASRDASAPVDVTVGGYAGKSITLHVPDDAVFSQCDQGYFGSWTVSIDGAPGRDPYRYHQGPGQIDEVRILDVDGVLTVIDTAYYVGTPVEHVEEMRAIVESATFE